jgi:hypothetical protein
MCMDTLLMLRRVNVYGYLAHVEKGECEWLPCLCWVGWMCMDTLPMLRRVNVYVYLAHVEKGECVWIPCPCWEGWMCMDTLPTLRRVNVYGYLAHVEKGECVWIPCPCEKGECVCIPCPCWVGWMCNCVWIPCPCWEGWGYMDYPFLHVCSLAPQMPRCSSLKCSHKFFSLTTARRTSLTAAELKFSIFETAEFCHSEDMTLN